MKILTSPARRAAVRSAAIATALVAAAVGGANPAAEADARFALPDGRARGDGVTLVKTGERVRIGPSMAANGAGRSVWVSGNVKVHAPGVDTREAGPNNGPQGEEARPGSNGVATTGAAATLSVGYVVGCQVDVGQLKLGAEGSLDAAAAFSGAAGSISLPLAPGRVIYAPVSANKKGKQIEEPGTYFLNWRNVQMEIQGCGGYAQARSYAVIEVTGEDHQKITLWGKPFTIG
ncbi:hypothetical protein GOARA_021_00100 [Gordonia araii NBRC 100433]|uniref:MspA family protein n=1 Tax=Gordonia araii NBRC 100433 TaxID=1073574 RepID=G7GYU8_9ACTN|nr:MspA family porin [Gordonia araii]NNG96983.1 hypothetical protein [Gordonia araii NBRC 100433]GAB08773.1 hypothetical protein GOARA_021_00100 [Gordonia araii NBRC 100433]